MAPVKHQTPLPLEAPPIAAKRAAAAQDTRPDLATVEIADRLHSAAIHLLRRVRVRDRESGIGPAQLSALSVLVFAGPKSLRELADAEQVRPPTMSRVVAGLEKGRLVRRHATDDGRRMRLEATPKGVTLMWESRKRRVETLARTVAELPEAECDELRRALLLIQRIVEGI
jgi:DNA-binding MarR family transcriptional regulator